MDFLQLSKTIDRNSADMDEDDVLAVKSSLKNLNYYKEPKYGMTKFSDNEMFEGIKKFQTDNKLKVDGIMKPKGETENKVNEKIKTNTWGNKTNDELNKYVKNNNYSSQTRTGLVAPFYDMKRNYDDMKRLKLIGSDKFFHCKGNYEAAKRGAWGKTVAKAVSLAKETKDVLQYGIQDSSKDWRANKMGWNGAKENKSLLEACPPHPKYYK